MSSSAISTQPTLRYQEIDTSSLSNGLHSTVTYQRLLELAQQLSPRDHAYSDILHWSPKHENAYQAFKATIVAESSLRQQSFTPFSLFEDSHTNKLIKIPIKFSCCYTLFNAATVETFLDKACCTLSKTTFDTVRKLKDAKAFILANAHQNESKARNHQHNDPLWITYNERALTSKCIATTLEIPVIYGHPECPACRDKIIPEIAIYKDRNLFELLKEFHTNPNIFIEDAKFVEKVKIYQSEILKLQEARNKAGLILTYLKNTILNLQELNLILQQKKMQIEAFNVNICSAPTINSSTAFNLPMPQALETAQDEYGLKMRELVKTLQQKISSLAAANAQLGDLNVLTQQYHKLLINQMISSQSTMPQW